MVVRGVGLGEVRAAFIDAAARAPARARRPGRVARGGRAARGLPPGPATGVRGAFFFESARRRWGAVVTHPRTQIADAIKVRAEELGVALPERAFWDEPDKRFYVKEPEAAPAAEESDDEEDME